MQTRSFKLFALALPAGAFGMWIRFPSASAHDGHKKGHAPVTAKNLRNPVEHNAASIENGKALYEQYCAGCHGADGRGEQYNQTARVKAPDLKSEYVKKLADGEIFYVLTHGIKTSGRPGYRLKTSERERWQLVHYVRHFSMSEEEYAAKPCFQRTA